MLNLGTYNRTPYQGGFKTTQTKIKLVLSLKARYSPCQQNACD